MENIILVVVLLGIVVGIVLYLKRAKKKSCCLGCPHAKKCGGKCDHK